VGILVLGRRILLGILKKLFVGKSVQTDALPPADELTSMPIELGKTGQFLRREAVFDRNNRLSGHIFYLQQSPCWPMLTMRSSAISTSSSSKPSMPVRKPGTPASRSSRSVQPASTLMALSD
jgi:hypothetical protein